MNSSLTARLARRLLTGVVVAGACVAPAFAQVSPDGTVQASAAPYVAPQMPSGLGPQLGGNYRLRAGDQISLSVYGESQLSPPQPLRVLPGGAVDIPLVGEMLLGGKTPAQASGLVATRMRRYLRDPRVTIAIFSVAPVESLVLGNVRTPGKYVLQPPARLTDVIAAAGGLGVTDGDLPDARVQNAAGHTVSISLQKLLHDGDTALDVPIEPGDEVYVPAPNLFVVHVIGAVDKPGDVQLHEGDDLAMAVARAGTSTNQSPDLNNITVTRTGADGKSTTTSVNLYDVLKKGDLSKDLPMRKGDLVFVPQTRNHNGNGNSAFGDALGVLRRLVFF